MPDLVKVGTWICDPVWGSLCFPPVSLRRHSGTPAAAFFRCFTVRRDAAGTLRSSPHSGISRLQRGGGNLRLLRVIRCRLSQVERGTNRCRISDWSFSLPGCDTDVVYFPRKDQMILCLLDVFRVYISSVGRIV